MTPTQKKNKVGRPSTYSPELATELCKRIGEGKSLRTVCLEDDMPDITTVFEWIAKHEEFSLQYARATAERTEAQNEILLELGDEAIELAKTQKGAQATAVVQAVKIKADNLKWSMSKMKPKKYGEKLDVTSKGEKLPTPILGNALRSNDSDSQDSEASETN